MKNALLVLLMLLLPWQAITAAERNFVHVMNGKQSEASFVKHYGEHVEMTMHHHDDDVGDPSQNDDMQKSARHLADFGQGLSLNVLFPAPHAVAMLPAVRIAPAIWSDTFDDHTTVPPRRPPRTLI
jgi:hypothetical protein